MAHIFRPARSLLIVLGVMMALSGSLLVLAQSAADDDAAAQTEERAQADANVADDGASRSDDDAGVVLSPFDYEASEAISEDSAVAFPADI